MTAEQIENLERAARRAAVLTLMAGPMAPAAIAAPYIAPLAGRAASETAGVAAHVAGETVSGFLAGAVDPMKTNPVGTLIGWGLLLSLGAGAVWFFAPVARRKATAYRYGTPGGLFL